jgi:hypothetical protein
VGLKVIGAGFGRTGTLSLKLALEQLGYVKCHHMVEVFRSQGQGHMWKAIADGETPDWNKVFDGFQSSVDFPSSIFYRELAEKYPHAKVVLTVRSSDSWYKSASETIFAIGKATPGWLRNVAPHLGRIFHMHDKLLWERTFDRKTDDPKYAKRVYERHNAAVKAAIPADRLLVYEVKDGWGPLCAFLGKPVPETPFPNVNDTAEFRKRIRIMELLTWAPWVVLALIGCGLVLNAALTSGHGLT